MKSKRICIIGAGLSGLSLAWKKENLGHEVQIIEAASRVGGVLQSKCIEGYLLDYGANSLSLRFQDTYDTLFQMGVMDHAIDADSITNKRFIVRNGKLVALPLNLPSFFLSSFLSPLGKLRLLLEPFISKGNQNAKESVASFISRRLGKEALDYAANPFISGIYASKPETLNLANSFPSLYQLEQQSGSIFLGMLKKGNKRKRIPKTRLISFPKGMCQLTELIASSLKKTSIKTEESVIAVEKTLSNWRISTVSITGEKSVFECDEVISTLPIQKSINIDWKNLNAAENLSDLHQVTHYPLSLAYFGVDREKIKHPLDGFGFLVPEKENLSILGTLFSSTLFPQRAPNGKVLLTTFVGGERRPDLALATEDVISEVVREDLSKLIGLQGKPEFFHLKRWMQSIPLPDDKMNFRKQAADALSQGNEGLFFSGSAFTGVSLPNCIDSD